MKYAFIKAHQWEFKIRLMCHILQVNRSSYYDWLKSSPSFWRRKDQELTEEIKSIFILAREFYGTRRIKRKLKQEG